MISILVVYSSIGTMAYRQSKSTEWILLKHTGHILIGLAAMWIAHRIDYRFYSRLSKIGLWLSIPLLIYTFTNGVSLNDASRWIAIPLFGSFQPSDFASLVLIINIRKYASQTPAEHWRYKESLIPILMWCGIICGLIALTNLSTAILLLATCFLIMFIGRVPVKYLAMLVLVGVLAGAMALQFGVRVQPRRIVSRILSKGKELPFQAKHARIAVAYGWHRGQRSW